jgi:hypothetical protein
MSFWSERLKGSPVFEHLMALGPAIDDAESRDSVPQVDIESLERIRTVLTVVGQRLDTADGDLIRDSALEGLAPLLATTTQQVRDYAVDGDPQRLATAQAQVDSILLAVSEIVFPATKKEFDGLRGAVERYRAAMTSQLKVFEARATGHTEALNVLSGRLEEATTAFDAERKVLSDAVETFRAEVTKAQESLTAAYAATGQQLDDGVKAILAEIKLTFDEAEIEREKAHAASADEQKKSFNELVAKYDGALRDTQNGVKDQLQVEVEAHADAQLKLQVEYEQKANEILATIEGNLKRVQELVGVIGDLGVTSGHKTAADDALKEVQFWHRVTLWSMITLIAFAGATALNLFESPIDWLNFARRIYFSIAVGVLATYAASQANRYQQVERRNRKLELELKAIGPFLEPVEPAEREKFRLKLAEAFFGREDGPAGEPGPATLLHMLKSKENIETLSDALKIVIDKLRK